ncbi:MAG: hypothetical protein ACJATN_001665 [Neolewinella sp.]|jgi:hypothetical protein
MVLTTNWAFHNLVFGLGTSIQKLLLFGRLILPRRSQKAISVAKGREINKPCFLLGAF